MKLVSQKGGGGVSWSRPVGTITTEANRFSHRAIATDNIFGKLKKRQVNESLPLGFRWAMGWTLSRLNLGAISFVVLGLTGCSTMPLESHRIPHPSSHQAPIFTIPYQEAIGAIHIHTNRSDGTLPVETIARMAQMQGLDYLIVTDHNPPAESDASRVKRYGKTLVLMEREISTNEGHLLVFGIPQGVPSRQSALWTIEQVAAKGGLSFIAHPFWKKQPWTGAEWDGVTGLEIYDFPSDVGWMEVLGLGLWTLILGTDATLTWWLDRKEASLSLWDEQLSSGRRLVGIGSADAHGLAFWGIRLGPYVPLLKLVRNHLWIEGPLTDRSILNALKGGRVFVAHDAVADARGFQFLAVSHPTHRILGVMGDEVAETPSLRLYVYLPSRGEVSLWRDGKKVAQVLGGQHIWFDPKGPGVYRVEVTRKGKVWIYSNPIYVTAS